MQVRSLTWWRRFAGLFLLVGLVLSPLRAVAATVPIFVAYDPSVRPMATKPIETGPSLRPEHCGVREYRYGAVHVLYDEASNSPIVGEKGADRPWDGAPKLLERRELGDAQIYGVPAATAAAEAVGAEARSVGTMAADEPLLNGSAKSTPTWGHTFLTHGEGEASGLLGRAAGTGQAQGMWLDNEAAAQFLSAERPYIQGPASVQLPPGLGQVIRADGTIVRASRATLIPGPCGGFRTAFPIE